MMRMIKLHCIVLYADDNDDDCFPYSNHRIFGVEMQSSYAQKDHPDNDEDDGNGCFPHSTHRIVKILGVEKRSSYAQKDHPYDDDDDDDNDDDDSDPKHLDIR